MSIAKKIMLTAALISTMISAPGFAAAGITAPVAVGSSGPANTSVHVNGTQNALVSSNIYLMILSGAFFF